MRDQPRGDVRITSPGESLAERRDRLYARLATGWARIDSVEAAGGDAERLIGFWLDLLREYERICDALAAERAAAAVPAPVPPSRPGFEG